MYVHQNSNEGYGKHPDEYIDVEVTFSKSHFDKDSLNIMLDEANVHISMSLYEFDYLAEQVEKARTDRAILAKANKEK